MRTCPACNNPMHCAEDRRGRYVTHTCRTPQCRLRWKPRREIAPRAEVVAAMRAEVPANVVMMRKVNERLEPFLSMSVGDDWDREGYSSLSFRGVPAPGPSVVVRTACRDAVDPRTPKAGDVLRRGAYLAEVTGVDSCGEHLVLRPLWDHPVARILEDINELRECCWTFADGTPL